MSGILVVDPSPSIRETLRIVLEGEHDVDTAPDLEDVRLGDRPALVILGLRPLADVEIAGRTLKERAPAVPVLLLHQPGDVDLRHVVPPGGAVAFLPKPFDAHGLRAKVRALLAPGTPAARLSERLRSHLEYPFLSPAAAVVARQAAASDLPVLIVGERGCGAEAVARALHFCARAPDPFLVIDVRIGEAPCLDALSSGTIFVDGVELASPALQRMLREALDQLVPMVGAKPRIIATTQADLVAEAAEGRFLPELAYALTTLVLPLAALRERGAEIPDLVCALSRDIAQRLHLGPVTYTAAALERLRQYLWFGNVVELEAVVGRTLALRRPTVVDAPDLIFTPAATLAAVSAAVPRAISPPAPIASERARTPNLEVLLGELAHELRNPMVTIKTFAQHIESVLADPEVRARFSALTADAVTRMDRLLETLLDFARFRAPAPRPIDLGALLARVFAEHAEDLERKSIHVDRNGDLASVSMVVADEPQVLFALRQLSAGLVGDLVPHLPIRITMREAGVLELTFKTDRTVAERLAAFVDDRGDGSSETPPLYVALAAALLERNKGCLRVRGEPDGTSVVTIALPPLTDGAAHGEDRPGPG